MAFKPVNFGELPGGGVRKSPTTYPAYSEQDCEMCFTTIWEGDDLGFVEGEKACYDCWDAA